MNVTTIVTTITITTETIHPTIEPDTTPEIIQEIRTGWKVEDDLDGEFDNIAVICEQPQDTETALGILSYFLDGPMALGGEFGVSVVSNQVFLADLDITKSQRDDFFDALPFLRDYLTNGTPVRKTDRAGVGTRGTRKYAALVGEFEIYFA